MAGILQALIVECLVIIKIFTTRVEMFRKKPLVRENMQKTSRFSVLLKLDIVKKEGKELEEIGKEPLTC